MSYKIKCTLISSYYILSLLLRKKLSIDWMKTKEIYQLSLNIYKKAWLNTYLAKTPILITVEFQELLEIFMGIFYLHLHSYSSLAKRGSIRNRISVGFKFSTSHFVDGRVFFWFSFFWFSFLDFEGHTSIRGKKTIYKQKSQARLASGTGNPGWSRKRVYLLRSHQDSHQ